MDVQEMRWEAWTGLIWLRTGTGTCIEHSNEPLGSIKCRDFLTSREMFSFAGRSLLHGMSK